MRDFGDRCEWDGMPCECAGVCRLDERLRALTLGRVENALDANAREQEEAVCSSTR